MNVAGRTERRAAGAPWASWGRWQPRASGGQAAGGHQPLSCAVGRLEQAGRKGLAAELGRAQVQACTPPCWQAALSPLPDPSTQTLPQHAHPSAALPWISTACRGEVGGTPAPAPNHSTGHPEFLETWVHPPGYGGHRDPLWLKNTSFCAQDLCRQPPEHTAKLLSPGPACRACRPGSHPSPSPPWLRLTLGQECFCLAKP